MGIRAQLRQHLIDGGVPWGVSRGPWWGPMGCEPRAMVGYLLDGEATSGRVGLEQRDQLLAVVVRREQLAHASVRLEVALRGKYQHHVTRLDIFLEVLEGIQILRRAMHTNDAHVASHLYIYRS
jgi:hypothetical protein